MADVYQPVDTASANEGTSLNESPNLQMRNSTSYYSSLENDAPSDNGRRAESTPSMPPLRSSSVPGIRLSLGGRSSSSNHNRPLLQQLLHGHYPMDQDAADDEERMVFLPPLRPSRLIGEYTPLCDWAKMRCPTKVNSKTKKYYEEQGELIDRLVEIDEFLDAGKMHLNILSNYGEPGEAKEAPPLSSAGEYQRLIPGDVTAVSRMAKGDSLNSHKSRRLDEVPGNVNNEGAQFLGHDQVESNYQVHLAIMVNFFVNFVLLAGKIAVLIMTNSMSMVASLVDSVLDFLSTFIIYIANRLTRQKNWKVGHLYPVGRSRLEPLGVLVFSVIIIISFFQVGQESFKRLFLSDPSDRSVARIGTGAIIIMLITIFAKLGCWIWCLSSSSSSVQALAQDAMTDIVFNTVSLLMPTAGHFLNIWWLDPLGALLLSVYIIILWCATAFEHIDNLTGAAADPIDYKVILYLAFRFAESIKKITALKVYHVGDHLNVEIDVVFALEDFDLTFKDCHDIAEALQYLIETLPMVERAFVHIDYMAGNYKGHLN